MTVSAHSQVQCICVGCRDNCAPNLCVQSVPAERYLQNFSWEESKYPHRRPLPELVSLIQAVSQGDRRSDF